MPERELRQRIRARLKSAFPGALVLQWPSNMWTGPGWPDLLFSEWPLLVGFEVKHGRRSKPTPIQRSRHVELRNHHVPVYVVYGPDDAVDTITSLKEKLPMAFDPNLLAELDAALNASPDPEPAPLAPPPFVDIPINMPPESNLIAEQANDEQLAHDLTNGIATLEDLPTFDDVVLPEEAPTPGIEDLTAAVRANAEISIMETDALIEIADAQQDVLALLKASIDALTAAIHELHADLNADIEADNGIVPQTVEAPAPRSRRPRRS